MDHNLPPLTKCLIKEIVERALFEDLPHGDLTTQATITPGRRAKATILAKEDDFLLAGCQCVEVVFEILAPSPSLEFHLEDGQRVQKGEAICTIEGEAATILQGERVALNFLQRLSGIATLTNRFVEQVRDLRVRICDTRKTTPGLRVLEKYAVRVGGGHNHRFSLSDGVLIKDNHIVACGGIEEAVKMARKLSPHPYRIEVEVDSVEGAKEAISAGADAILLDNMGPDQLREAVQVCRDLAPHILLEASGGVRLENVREIAETGVDIISVGALTHSAPSVDISMEFLHV